MEDEPKKLNAKQQRFVVEYCVDFNGTKAAKRCGYSEKSAYSIASENLRKPEIKKAILERVEALTMSADEAMVRMSDFARGSFEPFLVVNKNNDILIDLTTDEAKSNIRLIKKLKQVKRTLIDLSVEVTTEIEIHDAKDATGKILQVHGKGIDRNVNIKQKIEDLDEDQINRLIDKVLSEKGEE